MPSPVEGGRGRGSPDYCTTYLAMQGGSSVPAPNFGNGMMKKLEGWNSDLWVQNSGNYPSSHLQQVIPVAPTFSVNPRLQDNILVEGGPPFDSGTGRVLAFRPFFFASQKGPACTVGHSRALHRGFKS
ncbi:hypothetical protein B0H16DRAFT_1470256 [Mycena metata]|uniref:Uncharacterized protein n=1 Tax=Mycena metata TaxID=1033252 RepID=A0AAD7HWG4_9AGAR|nr:hypothetical protein B0H16DRAFT_1470256 [Mycena metata]